MATAPIVDYVSFSGRVAFTRIAAIDVTRESVTDAIVTAATSVGWVINVNSSQTFGDYYILHSQQSTFYDIENIPAWYTGNSIRLEIDNNSSLGSRFGVGALRTTGATELVMDINAGESFLHRITTAYDVYIHVTPYQIIIWRDTLLLANSERDQFLVSALNVPRPLMQRRPVEHNIIASDDFRQVSGFHGNQSNQYICYQEKDSSIVGGFANTSNVNQLHTLIQRAGPESGLSTGRKIWYRAFDLDMSDPTQWIPFVNPGYAGYTLPGDSYSTMPGFLWDVIFVSETYQANSDITAQDRKWHCFVADETENRLSVAGFVMKEKLDL